jgi:hypothetical protein
MVDHLITLLIPYANPPRTIRLIIASINTPTGVIRIVHPTRRRWARVGRDELEGLNWLVIRGH